jgi:hypothetical protein
MKMCLSRVITGASILCLFGIEATYATTTTVSSIPALQSAINSAHPGDVIILADGTYSASSAISVGVAGTAAAPITIQAATIGGATIGGSHGFDFASTAAYATVQGFVFKHSAGTAAIEPGASHCRLSRNVFQCPGNAAELNIMGDDSEIDFNEFAARNALGQAIEVEGPSGRIAQHVWIHHNYFHDLTNSAGGNGAETIRFGLSGISLTDGFAIVEYNLLLRCDAEPESISNKSCNNIYRYNTLNDNTAEFTLRHGNFNMVYGNYFINTPGCRFFGKNNKIFSNFFTGCNPAVYIGNGDTIIPPGPLGGHDRPDSCEVTYNTLVDNTVNMILPSRSGGLGATNLTIANNIIQGGGAALTLQGPFSNPTYLGNILFDATAGAMPASGYITIDPKLAADGNGEFHLLAGSPAINAGKGSFPYVTVDMDGQPRDSMPDVGADEFSSAPVVARILTAADVGPNASVTPQAAAPVFTPGGGTYASAQIVAISSTDGSASIRYTTDGSTPSETVGTIYSGAISLSSTTTLSAIAYGPGLTDSTVTSAVYTIGPPPQQVAAPTFSPDGGTYTSAQMVSLSSATSGALFRYTTDGSTPSETVGTPYSNTAISVSATTTLKAIAYESGFTDSTVTSATYTFGPPPTLSFEAASMSPVGTGATVSSSSDTNVTGGLLEFLNATAAGQFMTLTTPSIPAGTYQVQFRYKTNTSRGQHTVAIDGAALGGTIDQYATTSTYPTATLGNVTFATTGTHTIVLTVTGKDSAATHFYITADKFVFVSQSAQVSAPSFSPGGGTYPSAQNVTLSTATSSATISYTTDGSTPSETNGTIYPGTAITISTTTVLQAIAYEPGFTDSTVTSATYTIGIPQTFNFEAASMSPVGTGATVSTSSDPNVTGGLLEFLNATATGQSMTLTTPSIPAGTYQVQFRYRTNTSRGQHTVAIDGTPLGGTIDQYATTSTYPTATLGTVTFATTGTHTIVLTVTGKDSAATHFYITADKFTFVGQ